MTAASSLPLRPKTATAGICWDHRLVPLRRAGTLKERQHEGRMIRCGRARAPIVGRGARQTKGDEISGLDVDGGKGLVKHGSRYYQRKIRQSESCACNSPTIGHNEHMSKTYKAILTGNGSEQTFDNLEDLQAWASKATITFGCDLDIEVVEMVEKRFSVKADWLTGEVKEVAV